MDSILVRSDSWEELVPSAVQEHSYDNLLDTPGFRSGVSNERHLSGAFEHAARNGLLTGI